MQSRGRQWNRGRGVKALIAAGLVVIVVMGYFMMYAERKEVQRAREFTPKGKEAHPLPGTAKPEDERKIAELKERSETHREQLGWAVWLNISAGEVALGRVEVGLFASTPLTSLHFLRLATNAEGELSYAGSVFHRIIPGFVVQGGGLSLSPQQRADLRFDDEESALRLKHDGRYIVQMANAGPNTNLSQFCFMLGPAPHLNGLHAVFGRVISGFHVIDMIETLARNDPSLSIPISISSCGSLPLP